MYPNGFTKRPQLLQRNWLFLKFFLKHTFLKLVSMRVKRLIQAASRSSFISLFLLLFAKCFYSCFALNDLEGFFCRNHPVRMNFPAWFWRPTIWRSLAKFHLHRAQMMIFRHEWRHQIVAKIVVPFLAELKDLFCSFEFKTTRREE